MSGIRHFVKARLHRRIFMWFGASIIATGVVVGLVLVLLRPAGPTWPEHVQRVRQFAGTRFAKVWDDEAERTELTHALSRELGVDVTVLDSEGMVLTTVGNTCDAHAFTIPVERNGDPMGTVNVCPEGGPRWDGVRLAVVLIVCGGMLWAASGRIARRLARPLGELVRVTEEIGRGNLSARVRLGRHRPGEIGLLADSIDDMSGRIEKQMADQRELLAAVSHEVRTPLARLRVLLEIARDGQGSDDVYDQLEREILEIDALVGELLASSRVDFAAMSWHDLDAEDVARRALERAGSSLDLLAVSGEDRSIQADATLLARALANLLDNADKHGGGVTHLQVNLLGDQVEFAVEDHGPGFSEDLGERAFEPFARGDSDGGKGSLGLGLSLVRRIAEAHGGSAAAESRPGGGSRVYFRVKRRQEFPTGP